MNNKIFINYTSEELIWNGPEISCIKLCKGDTVSKVIYEVASRLCEIVDSLEDLKNLDLSCIIDKCDETFCYEDHSIANVLRIIQKNDCSLKELLDEISTSITDSKKINLNLDLSCLKTCPDYKNPKYQIICAKGGIPGDKIDFVYKKQLDPTNLLNSSLKNNECLILSLPNDRVVFPSGIVSYTVISSNPSSKIKLESYDSIGFDNCPDCEKLIGNLVDSTTFPGFFKQKAFTLNQILQYLVYRICCQDNTIADLDLKLKNLEHVYTGIIESLNIYKEPLLTSCINSTPLLHSLLTPRLATYLCNLRENLGSYTEVHNSIANQCNAKWISTNYPQTLCSPFLYNRYVLSVVIDGVTYLINENIAFGQISLFVNALNNHLPGSLSHFYDDGNGQVLYNGVASSIVVYMYDCNGTTLLPIQFNKNFINATNLAQDSQNQWSVLCDLLYRVKSQENSTCCLPDCGEVKFGYRIFYSESDQIHKITFSKSYGTKIPTGWSDNGSLLTVKDINGLIYSTIIEITEESTFELDLDGLDVSKVLSVSIKTNFIHENGLVCKNILVDHIDPIPVECSYCKICAYGSNENDEIRIYYTIGSNPTIRYQNINPGGCITFKLPEEEPKITNIQILSAASDAFVSPDPSSDCANLELPEPIVNSCWFFPIPISDSFMTVLDDWVFTGLIPTNFDFASNSDYTYTYKELIINNGNSIALSGITLSVAITNANPGLTSNGIEEILITANSPTSSIIPLSKSCGEFKVEHDADLSAQGRKTLGIAGSNAGSNNRIRFQYSNSGGGNFGIILELPGVSLTSIPELVITDPITDTDLIIKGTLQEDSCECQ